MPIISIAQQMAFYLDVNESDLNFTNSYEDSCTVEVNGDIFDVFFNPVDLIVTEYIPSF